MTHKNCSRWVAAVCLLLALQSQAAYAGASNVKVAPVGRPVKVDASKGPQPIEAKRFFVKPNNEKIGTWQDNFFCSGGQDIRFNDKLANSVMQNVGLVVRAELQAAGYPEIRESAFSGVATREDSEYELAATLTAMQLDFCGSPDAFKGGMWVSLDWELFSPRERRVVYRATHEGSFHDDGKDHHIEDVSKAALASATRNLLADPKFVGHATQRAQSASTAGQLTLVLDLHRSGAGKALDRMPLLQSSVVTVFSGAGSGSGFYVSADGHLLTNQHVVGDAKFVKVKLATGRELLGEVVRSVVLRDVALVKTDTVALAPLEIAFAEPRVGDEVYALGSPLGDKFASTVTRGVLSGTRDIEKQRWLQSDVKVLPGSSGGPLIGADGGVVGVTARGIEGLNLFIPISEALSALNIEARKP